MKTAQIRVNWKPPFCFLKFLLFSGGVSWTVALRFSWKLIGMSLDGEGEEDLDGSGKPDGRDDVIDGVLPDVVGEDQQGLVNVLCLKKKVNQYWSEV